MNDTRSSFDAPARALVRDRDRLGAAGIVLCAELADMPEHFTLADVVDDLERRRAIVAITDERDEIDRAIDALGGAARNAAVLRLGLARHL